jgi:hypothetical protein
MGSDLVASIAGLVVLLAAKLLAYAWFLRALGRRWQVQRNAFAWAGARIALGAVLGGSVLVVLGGGGRDSFLPAYFVALGLGRVAAWAIILGAAFREYASVPALAVATVAGVLLSYTVEIPVLMGWIAAIGGIC